MENWNEEHPDDQIVGFQIESETDIAAYQGGAYSANPEIDTYQMGGDSDNVAGNRDITGATRIGDGEGKGHDLNDYNAGELPKGKRNPKKQAKQQKRLQNVAEKWLKKQGREGEISWK